MIWEEFSDRLWHRFIMYGSHRCLYALMSVGLWAYIIQTQCTNISCILYVYLAFDITKITVSSLTLSISLSTETRWKLALNSVFFCLFLHITMNTVPGLLCFNLAHLLRLHAVQLSVSLCHSHTLSSGSKCKWHDVCMHMYVCMG